MANGDHFEWQINRSPDKEWATEFFPSKRQPEIDPYTDGIPGYNYIIPVNLRQNSTINGKIYFSQHPA